MTDPIDLLRQLVAIESVNPAYGGSGESAVAQFVEEWLAQRGLSPQRQEVFPGRDNVFARLGNPDEPAVLIDAHMDTVGVEGWALGSPFELVEREGRFYGRGSCDTKASLAVFMCLAERFAGCEKQLKRPLLFAATVDEESAQTGAMTLMDQVDYLGIGAAITGEPTLSRIVNSHKGVCRYTIELFGKAAHGSSPELGDNAILKAARVLSCVEALAEDLEARPRSCELERGTINVGRIEGGIGFNIVPDHCSVGIDRRIGSGESVRGAFSELKGLLDASKLGGRLIAELERPPLETPIDNWFPQALKEASESVGIPRGFESVSYMTNGVAYSERNLPTLVFGPGSIAQAHKVDEYIEPEELMRSFRILERFFSGQQTPNSPR